MGRRTGQNLTIAIVDGQVNDHRGTDLPPTKTI